MSQISSIGGGSGGGAWGEITGTLSAQTDLQSELDAKVGDTGNETVAGVKTFSDNLIIGGGASASELRLLEPSGSGIHYSAFKAQAQASDLTYTLPPAHVTNGYMKNDGSGGLTWATVSAVTGPGSSTDNAIVRWDGAGGSTVQNSTTVTLDDAGLMTITPTGSPTNAFIFSGASLTTFTTNMFQITGTFPTASAKRGFYVAMTGATASGVGHYCKRSLVSSGSYTASTVVGYFNEFDSVNNTGKQLGGYSQAVTGNVGIYNIIGNSNNAGLALGGLNLAYDGNWNVGATCWGIRPAGTTPKSYGVHCLATGENSAIQVAVFGVIRATDDATAESSHALASAAAYFDNGDTTADILALRDGTVEKFVVEDGGTVDMSGISAGVPNFRITATSDTPTVTWGAAAGNESSTTPAGYLEISVGGNARYIPFWA